MIELKDVLAALGLLFLYLGGFLRMLRWGDTKKIQGEAAIILLIVFAITAVITAVSNYFFGQGIITALILFLGGVVSLIFQAFWEWPT